MTDEFTKMIVEDRVPKGELTVFKKTGYVLIVDDDPVICDLLLDFFAEHDLSAMAVSDRASLHHHLARAEPRLILLDLHVHREDGLDILREIRSRSDIPVIIM